MPGTGSAPERKVSVVSMQVECPQCGERMLVDIGLNAGPTRNSVVCVGCHKSFVAVFPGSIVGGPF